jgi:hypothetical protein
MGPCNKRIGCVPNGDCKRNRSGRASPKDKKEIRAMTQIVKHHSALGQHSGIHPVNHLERDLGGGEKGGVEGKAGMSHLNSLFEGLLLNSWD